LLLLRLFKPHDISFVKLAVVLPSGQPIPQPPYRAINDLNIYPAKAYAIESEECEKWESFTARTRTSQSWNSDWFGVARRLFLSGGAKPFNPNWDDVDRILDYVTALEATLVPEPKYNRRRISRRAAALIEPNGPGTEGIINFMKRLYDVRSQIVHGRKISSEDRRWLAQNHPAIETNVRRILQTALEKLPPGEEDRLVALAKLYDPIDEEFNKSSGQE